MIAPPKGEPDIFPPFLVFGLDRGIGVDRWKTILYVTGKHI